MPLPATLWPGASWPDHLNCHVGPFEVGGALYAVAVDKTNNHLEVGKSTDGGNTWAEVDAANSKPITTTAGLKSAAACLDGTTLAIAYKSNTNAGAMALFDTTTDTWGAATSIGTANVFADVTGAMPLAIVARAPGDYVYVYIGQPDSIMGTGYDRVSIARYSSGAWQTFGVKVESPGTQIHQAFGGAVLGSGGRVHIYYRDRTNNALRQNTLLTSNAFGGAAAIDSTIAAGSYPLGLAASYVDGADRKVVIPYVDSTGDLNVARFTSADVPTFATQVVTTTNDPETATSNPGAVAVDGATVHAFWPDAATDDLWRDSDAGTGTWGADVEHRDAITVGGINVAKVTGAIGLLYDDGGTVRFDTFPLAAGPVGPVALSRTAADSVAVSDAVARITQRTRSAGEVVAITDAAAGTFGLSRAAANTVSVANTATRSLTNWPRTATEPATTISDAAVTSVTAEPTPGTFGAGTFGSGTFGSASASAESSSSRTASDSVSVSNVATRSAASLVRALAESVAMAESVARAGMTRARAASETVAITDAVTRTTGRQRTAADSVAVGDAASRTTTRTRSTMQPAATVTDAVAVRLGKQRAATEPAAGVGDTATRTTGRQRTATDSFSLGDAVARTIARMRTASQPPLAATDQVVAAGGAGRTATDGVSVSDTALRTMTFGRAAANIVSISDTAARAALTRARTASEMLAVTDAVARIVGRARSASDSVAVSDTAIRAAAGRQRTTTETVTVTDVASVEGGGTISRVVADVVSVADMVVRSALGLARAAVDALGVTDAAVRTTGRARTAADSLAITDAVVIAADGSLARSATEAVAVSDAVSRAALTPSRTAAETVAMGDMAVRTTTRARVTMTTLAVSDEAVITSRGQGRAASETVLVSDTATRGASVALRSLSEPALTIADSVLGERVVFTGQHLTFRIMVGPIGAGHSTTGPAGGMRTAGRAAGRMEVVPGPSGRMRITHGR